MFGLASNVLSCRFFFSFFYFMFFVPHANENVTAVSSSRDFRRLLWDGRCLFHGEDENVGSAVSSLSGIMNPRLK